MNELLKILDDIILELDSLSDEQLQASFEACKGGLIGSMMLDSKQFFNQHLEVVLSNYDVSVDDMSSLYQEIFANHDRFISRIDEIYIEIADAANDEHYLMAA